MIFLNYKSLIFHLQTESKDMEFKIFFTKFVLTAETVIQLIFNASTVYLLLIFVNKLLNKELAYYYIFYQTLIKLNELSIPLVRVE